jgi:hypothetical protein
MVPPNHSPFTPEANRVPLATRLVSETQPWSSSGSDVPINEQNNPDDKLETEEKTDDEPETEAKTDDEPETEEGTDTVTELEECLLDINHLVTCLYKFLIAIQNPAPLDRLRESSTIDVSHFEKSDIEHVTNKFPEAEKFIQERLGKANTKRRQLLRYYAMRHEKIVGRHKLFRPEGKPASLGSRHPDLLDGEGLAGTVGPEDGENRSESADDHDHTFILGMSSGTITTTDQSSISAYISRDPNTRSEAGCSKTSYPPSVSIPRSIRVPPPPNKETALNGVPFLCPYCFQIVELVNQYSWM